MLKEFERVLRPNGTMAVLLNLQAEQALRPLLVNWTTSQCRFSMTRHTVGVLLVAQPGRPGRPGRLEVDPICDWRSKGLQLRGLWRRERGDARPHLRPAFGEKNLQHGILEG